MHVRFPIGIARADKAGRACYSLHGGQLSLSALSQDGAKGRNARQERLASVDVPGRYIIIVQAQSQHSDAVPSIV
jgi:hypothetical protein